MMALVADSLFPSGNGLWMHKKDLWQRRGITEEIHKEGSEAHSRVHSVPQVLVYLEVSTMSSFGVLNLSRLK